MSADDKYFKGLGIALFVLLFCIGLVVAGHNTATRQIQHEAIRLGHAEWVADKDGQPVFRWKERAP